MTKYTTQNIKQACLQACLGLCEHLRGEGATLGTTLNCTCAMNQVLAHSHLVAHVAESTDKHKMFQEALVLNSKTEKFCLPISCVTSGDQEQCLAHKKRLLFHSIIRKELNLHRKHFKYNNSSSKILS